MPATLARYTLHRDVVVLGGLVVGTAGLRLAVDRLGEVVERARVGSGAEQLQRHIREARANVLPVVHLRARLPDLLQLGDCEALRPCVLLVDDDGQCVVGDGERAPGADVVVLAGCFASLIFIGREASDRSISPLQKRWKPPPVPEMPTVTLTPPAPALRKSSAAAVVYGPTVDEPSAVIEPLSS